ncbi:hypothetical protein BXT84_00490 [Sulfobacillus thermotolerans]|uniref:Type II secretion system protein GspF domain-containing protein n=1 Tax=Sulfobacillus thermotolerans TaxID=338644 RepID=A0ABM6RMN7_9FIRM|nr:hypothetical protein BXT84_00490 [Sulfobacillus thermotolerans]
MHSLMLWGVAVLGLLLMGWGVWQWRSVPVALSWQPPPVTVPPVLGLNASWLALTGWPLTPRRLQIVNGAAAGLALIGVTVVTRNPLVGIAGGVFALGIPEGIVRWQARRRWKMLDETALSACTSLRFALEDHQPVLPTWQRLYAYSTGAWRTFLAPCLTAEATGQQAFETVFKQTARAIHHVELQLVGDIVATERTRGNTVDLLATILHLWSQRLEADARRRGQIHAGAWLSRVLLWGGVVGFVLIWTQSPAVAHGAQHGIGFVVVGAGALVIALGAWVQRQAERKAEQV